MKIEVLSYEVSKNRPKKDCNLSINFSFTTSSGDVFFSAAEIDMTMLSFFVGRINDIATSFLYFSAIIYAIDRSISRDKYSIDGWSRDLDIVIKIPNSEFFENNKGSIVQLLSFLTGDYWTLSFQESLPVKVTKYKDSDYFNEIEQVNLFSGGLDSLIGAIDFMSQYPEKKLFLASHYDGDMAGPRIDQQRLLSHFADKYKGQYVLFPKRHSVRVVSRLSNETSCRSRSLLFIAIALQIADYSHSKIVIPENGSVSLNYPLSASRRSSCSTRTTHPVVISCLQRLFLNFGLSTEIENPYEFKTKGEMVKDCEDQEFLLRILADSNSCGKRSRRQFFYDDKGATHCGHCMPCMYRRAALIGYNDLTTYGNELNSLFGKPRLQLTDDFFAMLNFLKTNLTDEDIRRELRIAKVNELPNFERYVDLVKRTRSELSALITALCSSDVKHYTGLS